MENGEVLMQRRETNTRAFLTSYAIRERLAQADVHEEGCDTASPVALSRPNPYHPFLAEGQVRLLGQLDEIVYVLLLKRWDDRSYLVIPFSSFPAAATDLEYRLAQDLGGLLEVLQIWNARTLQNSTLAQSWLVTRLDAIDCEAARTLWEYSIGGDRPSDEVLSRTGVPIGRRDDPRITYQDRVLATFAGLDKADMESAENAESNIRTPRFVWRRPNPFAPRERFASELRLAAAETAVPVSATRKLGGFDGSLLIRFRPDDLTLNIRVFDAAGEKSMALDGWAVLGGEADVLGYVEGSALKVKVPAGFDGCIRFLDLEGQPHDLTDEA